MGTCLHEYEASCRGQIMREGGSLKRTFLATCLLEERIVGVGGCGFSFGGAKVVVMWACV